MRILKRNLAFMLTLAMVLGVMVSASAMNVKDYTDYNEIKFVEAIDVLTSLGVLEGENGEFNPQDILTREQGAKIISYVMLGKDGAEGLTTSVAPFSDVAANRWSAGYVAYCASQGIINGIGGGKFDPEAPLTANQFAKMLLVALGYGVNDEYVGANWEIEASKQALLEGIFDDNLGANFAEGVKREEAALYAFNALTGAMTVSYSETFGTYYSGKLFNSVDEFDEKYTLGYKLYNVTSKDTTDDFGRDAHYWVKNKTTKVSNTYHEDADAVYTAEVKSGTIYKDLGLTKTVTADVIRNGAAAKDMQIKKNLTSVKLGGNGVLVEAYVDDYENVKLVVIDTFLAKVTSVDDGEVTVADLYKDMPAHGTFDTAVEYAKDDYVLVTIAAGEIQSMKAAEYETGKMNVYADKYVTMNDTKMNKSAQLRNNDDKASDAIYAVDYDSEMRVYLDEYGYVAAVVVEEEAETEYGYVRVTDSLGKKGSLLDSKAAVVEVQHLDGSKEVLPLETQKKDGNTQYRLNGEWVNIEKDGAIVENGFYRFTMTDAGEIVLKALDADKAYGNNSANVSFKKAQNGTVTGLTGNKFMNANTVYHQVTDKDVKTFTGYKNIDVDATAASVLVLYNGRIITDLYTFEADVASSELNAYYDGTNYETKDGTVITLYINGEAKNYEVTSVPAKGAYKVTVKDNEATIGAPIAFELADKAKVTEATETYFEVNDTKYYYDEEVEIFDVTDGGAAAEIALNDYVVFAQNKDGFVELVYILEAPEKEVLPDAPAVDKTHKVEVVPAGDGKTVTIKVANVGAEEVVSATGFKFADGQYGQVNTVTAAKGVDTVAYTVPVDGQYRVDVFVDGVKVDAVGPFFLTK